MLCERLLVVEFAEFLSLVVLVLLFRVTVLVELPSVLTVLSLDTERVLAVEVFIDEVVGLEILPDDTAFSYLSPIVGREDRGEDAAKLLLPDRFVL